MYLQALQNKLKQTIFIDGRPIEAVPIFKDTDLDWNDRDPKRNVAIILQDGIRTFDRLLFRNLYHLGNPPYFDGQDDIEFPFTCSQFDNFKEVLRKNYKYGDFQSERYVELIVDYLVVSSYMMPIEPMLPDYRWGVFRRLYDIYGDEIPVLWELLEPFIQAEIEVSMEDVVGFGCRLPTNFVKSKPFIKCLIDMYPIVLKKEEYKNYLESNHIATLLFDLEKHTHKKR